MAATGQETSPLVESRCIALKGPNFTCNKIHAKCVAVLEDVVVVVVVEVLLYVHRNHRLIRTGAQDIHLNSHRAPELWNFAGVFAPDFQATIVIN